MHFWNKSLLNYNKDIQLAATLKFIFKTLINFQHCTKYKQQAKCAQIPFVSSFKRLLNRGRACSHQTFPANYSSKICSSQNPSAKNLPKSAQLEVSAKIFGLERAALKLA